MRRVMNGVTNDPVGVDVGPIERHNRVPLVESQFRKRVEKRCRFSFNTEQRYVDVDLPRLRLEWWRGRLSEVGSWLRNSYIQEKPHSKDNFSHMIRVLSD